MSLDFSEDRLVQRTVADWFRDQLGWESVYGFNGTFGRASEFEVVHARYPRHG